MPELVADAPPLGGLRATVGFCGKLPARGDFVAFGLSRGFVDPWHDWMQCMLAASRERLGDGWLAAWLEAPIWRFVLAPGLCGPEAVLGLWLPSVDRIGRYFPLTVAAIASGSERGDLLAEGGDFLDAAEDAGRDALAADLEPDLLAARLVAAAEATTGCAVDPAQWPRGGALWWSAGGNRVAAAMLATAALPDGATFTAMLDQGMTAGPADLSGALK
jgi:type VI secretion system protein ImpM